MAELKNDDLLLVNRAGETYTAPGEAIYSSYLKKPEIGNFSLVESNPGVNPRFTNQEFVATLTMTEEGQPVSKKTFDAFVEGAILEDVQFNEPLESSIVDTSGVWTVAPAAPSPSIAWLSVTYGGDKFVAVGHNVVMRSTDGLVWTVGTSPHDSWWKSVVYGDSKFVAVAQVGASNYGLAMYSDDGIAWEIANVPAAHAWQAVSFGNNEFVAVAQTPAPGGLSPCMISTNGINWTTGGYITNEITWWKVAEGNGTWVAGGFPSGTWNSASSLVYSTNGGVTWRDALGQPEGAYVYGLAYGNGMFVAVGYELLLYSYDGITWYEGVGAPGRINLNCVTYADGKFVVMAGGVITMHSYDGINWETGGDSIENAIWTSITYGDNKFVAVAISGGYSVQYSLTGTGTTKTALTFAADADMEALAAGDAVSQGATTGTVNGINDTTVTLKGTVEGWVDGVNVSGPVKKIQVDGTKKYLKFTGAGQVTGLLDTPQSPAYVTTEVDPVLTLTFPSTFPSGFTPDEELGDGVTLTVEVKAENSLGTDGPVSDTVQPSSTVTTGIRSLTTEELEAQKLKFLTYNNRKDVVCGEEAAAARAALLATLTEAGYTEADINQTYSNLDD